MSNFKLASGSSNFPMIMREFYFSIRNEMAEVLSFIAASFSSLA